MQQPNYSFHDLTSKMNYLNRLACLWLWAPITTWLQTWPLSLASMLLDFINIDSNMVANHGNLGGSLFLYISFISFAPVPPHTTAVILLLFINKITNLVISSFHFSPKSQKQFLQFLELDDSFTLWAFCISPDANGGKIDFINTYDASPSVRRPLAFIFSYQSESVFTLRRESLKSRVTRIPESLPYEITKILASSFQVIPNW